MDYLILTIKTNYNGWESVAYLCVNGISRCKNSDGKEVLQYVISGVGQQTPIEDVLCITPSTPTPTQYEAFK